ncbi:hypothetical protein TNCV_234311 [Trichonephila clavipes]|uniref:Uncharacterized protein n=1 Tax=Trichonephila clavipes TaxID=2585209 RepID=A0A8X6SMI8_TRICX|nr:hypothetical protein TNCV_234311 [Trichonephila clavipes]
MGLFTQGLTKPFFVELMDKIDPTYYQKKVLRHMAKDGKRLYLREKLSFHEDSVPSHTVVMEINFSTTSENDPLYFTQEQNSSKEQYPRSNDERNEIN